MKRALLIAEDLFWGAAAVAVAPIALGIDVADLLLTRARARRRR